ncbi:hypothetical protein B484DRAFT_400194 [Ochromonadaceae sp. CCMP2298]|nr:hypothetical protein B484DRAFT_400194 [Ochromonadaceae sp. CCMP2298]
MAQAVRYVKAGGILRAFGAANGRLTTPVMRAADSPLGAGGVPQDDREVEVFYAGLAAVGVFSELGVQVGSAVNDDLHPWATLVGLALVGLGALDVSLRSGLGLRKAAAGVERLVLVDAERQAHCDGSAFLVGYLLGLPCFAFTPDVLEAVRLLRECPAALDVYKQPAALKAGMGMGMGRGGGSITSSFNALFKDFKKSLKMSDEEAEQEGEGKESKGKGKGKEGDKGGSKKGQELDLDQDLDVYLDSRDRGVDRRLGLGRVLVWMMAPVAGEYLKYGKTVLSDPRRCEFLLDVLAGISNEGVGSEGSEGKGSVGVGPGAKGAGEGGSDESDPNSPLFRYDLQSIPTLKEDRQALLEWAYYEATTLVRQYGDLLEETRLYLNTGTSTVGECALMIEDELR